MIDEPPAGYLVQAPLVAMTDAELIEWRNAHRADLERQLIARAEKQLAAAAPLRPVPEETE